MPLLDRASSRSAARKLSRLHQVARYASGLPCRAPDFLIVGAQKGGTTSLHAYLAQHPNVFPAVRKEVHFFETPAIRIKGDRWYRSFFPTQLYLRRQELRLGSAVLTGEATAYLPYPRVPQLLHAINPEARLIVLLRNPIERAYSHYWHVRRSYPGLETHSFSDAIRIEQQRIQADVDRSARDEWYDDVTFRSFSYVSSGKYAEQLKRWLAVFPRENLFIRESEHFFENPEMTMKEVCTFLEIPDCEVDVSEWHNRGASRYQPGAEDREFLIRAFADDRSELQSLLGRDFGATWF